MYYENVNLSDWVGKTLKSISENGDEIVFEFDNGDTYKMYHEQDCCESVYVESIVGSLPDLVGSPLTLAEEVSNFEEPDNSEVEAYEGSYTWTFYKFATVNGYVDIRWFGSSNGYYSESVGIFRIA